MPKGVYERRFSEAQRKSMADNLAKGRTKEARERARQTLKENAMSEEWRLMVSERTKEAMARPDVRKRHFAALQRIANERTEKLRIVGGNGMEPSEIIKEWMQILEPLGFIREFSINTAGNKTEHTPPPVYKVDFGNPETNVAIEIDGNYHKRITIQLMDRKKNEVLESLGWMVLRISE